MLVAATTVSIIGLVSCAYNRQISNDAFKEYLTKTGKTIIVRETHPVLQGRPPHRRRGSGSCWFLGDI